jgi:glucokinase
MKCAIGLDLGGTKIKGLAVTPSGKILAELVIPTEEAEEAASASGNSITPPNISLRKFFPKQARLATGNPRVHDRLPTILPLPRRGGQGRGEGAPSSSMAPVAYPQWAQNVQRAIHQIRRETGQPITCIGVAAPGLPAKNQRSIAFLPGRLPGLEGLVWQKFLHVHHRVPVLNDAQAALLGEVWRGAACRARNALLLTLGTGVGGAAMVDGHLLRGHLGRAGHLGHISLDPDGPLDIVNTPGSLEDLIGDATVAKRSQSRFNSTLELVSAARRGDAKAASIWLRSVKALAAAIASFINVLDPEIIILGGGIAQAGDELLRPLKQFLDKFEWRPGGARVRLVRAQLGERAGAFGAAFHALQFDSLSPPRGRGDTGAT